MSKWLVSAGIVVAIGQAGVAQDWTAVARQVTPSVVVIRSDRSQGSGFLVDSNGTIVTNDHLIDDATELTVTLNSGEVFSTVWIVATDSARDLAILRISGSHLPPLPLADSNEVLVGESVAVLGAPRGLEFSMSTGIVSAVRILDGSRVIQTTAPVSPGSSGSPLVNGHGEAIGVLTWARVGGNDLNFGIPINYVTGLLATAALTGNSRRLVAAVSADRRPPADPSPTDRPPVPAQIPADSVVVGGAGVGLSHGFWAMLRNLLDNLFEIGVHVANTEQIAAGQAFLRGGAVGNQTRIDRATALGASWVLVLTSNIQQSNFRDSAELECFAVPSGRRMWSTRVTDIARTVQAAVNDLSRDLARELQERIGQPCVTATSRE